MKKMCFFAVSAALLFWAVLFGCSGVSELSLRGEKTGTVIVEAKNIFKNANLKNGSSIFRAANSQSDDEYEISIYLRKVLSEEQNSEKPFLEHSERGSFSELLQKAFSFSEIPFGQKFYFYCEIAKDYSQLWCGKSDEFSLSEKNPSLEIVIQTYFTEFSREIFLEILKKRGESETSILEFEIPSGYERISENLFSNCENLKSVKISEGVGRIEKNAFLGCEKLSSVKIPKSVFLIGENAFASCPLESVEFESKNSTWKIFLSEQDSKTVKISDSDSKEKAANFLKEYSGCEWTLLDSENYKIITYHLNDESGRTEYENFSHSAGSVILLQAEKVEAAKSDCVFMGWYDNADFAGEAVEEFLASDFEDKEFFARWMNKKLSKEEAEKFWDFSLQEEIEIPFGVTEIDEVAFSSFKELKNVTIPKSVTKIGRSAFLSCANLGSAKIFGENILIDESAFMNCAKLSSVEISGSGISIGKSAFTKCAALESAKLDGVVSIGETAFWGCDLLEDVTFFEGLSSIGESAFLACSKLSKIEIPKSVTLIGKNAFMRCTKLSSAEFLDATQDWKLYKDDGSVDIKPYELGAQELAEYLADTYCSYEWQKQ